MTMYTIMAVVTHMGIVPARDDMIY